jgi:hypothetical protein
LAQLSEARPWAMSSAELVAAVDLAHSLAVEADAVLQRLICEVDVRDLPTADGASSTAVWLRNRYRMSIGAASRW